MLRIEDFNTVCRQFFLGVRLVQRCRDVLQAHPRMLRISQAAQMRRRDIEERCDVFE